MTDAVTWAGMSSLGYEAVGAQVEYAFERCGGIWRLADSSVFDGDGTVDCTPDDLRGLGRICSCVLKVSEHVMSLAKTANTARPEIATSDDWSSSGLPAPKINEYRAGCRRAKSR